MKLRTKIYLGFGVPLTILIMISAMVWIQTHGVSDALTLIEEEASYANRAQEMKLNVVQVQQWLTDISATGAAEGLDDGFDNAEENAQAFTKALAQFRERFQRDSDSEGLQKLTEIGAQFGSYYDLGKKMAKAYIEQGRQEGNKAMVAFDPMATAISESIDAFRQQRADKLKGSMEVGLRQSAFLKTSALVAALIAVLLSAATCWAITRSITRPINRVIAGLTDGAEQVTCASGQVASASQQLAEGASEQASSLEETSSALEEMSAMTRTNAANAKEANELAAQARSAADTGDKTMVQLNTAMSAINESSEKISKIIKVIEEIAFQTNLLALNAAVEAARAGEHGKGFAVVADEVRNLAQRAAGAARETTELIEGSVNNVRAGTSVASDVAKALGAIVSDVSRVSDLIQGISKASDEQAQGVEQVNTAVGQMDKVTQQNASAAEESASAAEELAAQAQAVKGMVGELIALVGGKNGEANLAASRPAARVAATSYTKIANRRQERPKAPTVASVNRSAPVEEFMPLDQDLKKF
ncbi:MAG: hypothetical protein AMXMBFR13_50350 [Phycisphaerae bacterium]